MLDTHEKLEGWLDTLGRTTGQFVHTLFKGQPVKATKTEAGWTIEDEGWVH